MEGTFRTCARLLAVTVLATVVPIVAATPALAARSKTLSIADVSVIETSGGTTLAFTVKWTGVKGGAAPSVSYATANGTATAGSDYTSKSGPATLTNAGCRCATISVPILDDAVSEGIETFTVSLSNPTNATIADGEATGTIYDNEGPVALVATDASADEGSGTLAFSVMLTVASGSTTTVDYATADGTATAGSDYTATSGTLTFNGAQMAKTVNVSVTNDAMSEADETLTLTLSNPSGAAIVDGTATGTIANDDADPDVSIGDAVVAEGDAGTSTSTLTVTLSAASGQETSVAWSTSDGTATGDADFVTASDVLTIPAGQLTGDIVVPVAGDDVHEGDETFGVTIADPIGLTITDASATMTITDDDPIPTVSAGETTVAEFASVASVALTLSNPSVDDVSFTWATADGSATAGADYAAAGGPLTIPAGETSVSVDVPILDDGLDEVGESFTVSVAGITNGNAGAVGTVSITDDDLTPTTLTLKASKSRRAVKAKGLLEPATGGLTVKVELLKKKGARYVRVATKIVAVKGLKDRDGDGNVDGQYRASFPRPPAGSYRVTASFLGTAEFGASTRSVNLRV